MSLRYVSLALALSLSSVQARAQTCATADLLTDPAGDYDGLPVPAAPPAGLPEHDLLGLSLSQTGTGEEAVLTFTLKTAGFSAPVLPPNAAWYSSFENADGIVFGVRMASDAAGAPSYFSYRAGESNGGIVDGRFVEAGTEKPAVAGSFAADGTVVISVKASTIGMEPGAGLGPFNGGTVQSVPEGLVAAVVDAMPVGLARDGFFDGCGKSAAAGKSSALLAGSLPGLSLLLLALAGLARRRG